MAETLDRIAERIRQLREAQRRATHARLEAADSRTAGRERGVRTGARVFDTVSGQEGEVIGRTVENVVVPTAKQ